MATKKKALKKSKLRHAEYYDFQEIQDKLYAESMDGKVFTKLVEIITLPENIKLAYRNIKKNKGSKTAGTDGKSIQHLEKLSEEKLVAIVQRKFSWYVPQSVRRVEIPKDNGKTRPLGIPTIMDRLVQQCILQVLEPICEAKFHDHSYGFRPNRSQQHANSQVHKNMQLSHLHYVVDIDIKGFFDNVNHGKLLKQLWTLGIRDKKLISIISAMLKAEVAGIGFPEKGTPQGGMKKATDNAVEAIRAMSSKVNGKEQIARVAAVSSGDEEVGQMVADAMEKVSNDGVITIWGRCPGPWTRCLFPTALPVALRRTGAARR